MSARLQREGLRELAQPWGFTLDDAEAEQLGAVADDLLTLLDDLDGGQQPAAAVLEAVREVGERPTAAEDPFNAIVRRCRVRAAEPGGPLAGMRLVLKDSMAIAGIPLTLGSAVMDGFVPDVDAVVVERLLRGRR